MSNFHYPSKDAYILPKKNILVLSCMDLRLTDNLVHFLNYDNMQNRYDQFILAGTSLLCTEKHADDLLDKAREKYAHWKHALKHHIELAKDLHGIKDVYIVEHQDCGAYAHFLKPDKANLSTVKHEMECHTKYAKELANDIVKQYKLNAHCFFIDLRGNIDLLYTKMVEKV